MNQLSSEDDKFISSCCSESEDSYTSGDEKCHVPFPKEQSNTFNNIPSTSTNYISRTILHLDIDAFYCQCEELANPSLASQPFAIGQKHIVVTCNYIARARGIKKLMLRTEAKKICPHLLILEGSNLEPYRRQAQRIYSAFRAAIAQLPGDNATKKGGMDEMFADITSSINNNATVMKKEENLNNGVFVFGESTSQGISISEDQSGATAYITSRNECRKDSQRGNVMERQACSKRLMIATKFANDIRCGVKGATGFTSCVGISTSPMLAKLASELKKPDSLNVLPPWNASEIIAAMPLRKVPGLGSRTLKSLQSLLEEYSPLSKERKYWTCCDLHRVPRVALGSFSEVLIEKCMGIDSTIIVDDMGGISKIVSVEDSYRRGSITTLDDIFKVLETLCVRLPRLLNDRRLYSHRPDLSYPTTIRFTARVLNIKLSSSTKRPFVTSSKQCKFDGRTLMLTNDVDEQSTILKTEVCKLVKEMFPRNEILNATKLNVAVTNFADIEILETEPTQKVMTHFFSSKNIQEAHLQASSMESKKSIGKTGMKASSLSPKRKNGSLDEMLHRVKTIPSNKATAVCQRKYFEICRQEIDESILKSLPVEIAAEVASEYGMKAPTKRKCKSRKIESYFRK